MEYLPWASAMVVAYLLGSIPFGLLIGLSRGVDIRRVGSGNIGATNAGRALGRKWGLTCFLLDVAKGAGPMAVAGELFLWAGDTALRPADCAMWLAVGCAALLGHIFPIYLRFKGGKGVATGFGVILGAWPYLTLPALGALGTWLIFAGALRYVGLASSVAAVGLPGWFLVAAHSLGWSLEATWPFAAVTGLMALVVVARHAGNLSRLAKGTEPRLGESPGAG